MLGFINFDKTIRFANLDIVKEFLKKEKLSIVESEGINQVNTIIKSSITDKPYVPHTYNVVIYDEDHRSNISAELYFTDYEVVLDCQVATHSFDYKWQTFLTYYLKDNKRYDYVRSIEDQMVKNLKLTDSEYLEEIEQNPSKKLTLSDDHDFMIKEIIIGFKYLKEIEADLGIEHKYGYNPFIHPYFIEKPKQPRLVDIIAACNARDRKLKEQQMRESYSEEK